MAKAAKEAKDREAAVDSSDDNTVTSAEPEAAKIKADDPPDVITRISSGLANLFLPGDS
jgi:hypothetical protein